MELAFSTVSEPATSPISPLMELGAYEAMWLEEGASVKKKSPTASLLIRTRYHPIWSRLLLLGSALMRPSAS